MAPISVHQKSSQPLLRPFTINDVTQHGLCVGCGACAVVDQRIKITRDAIGKMTADISVDNDLSDSPADLVCPFSDNSLNENIIGKLLYQDSGNYDERVGYFSKIYYGRRLDENTLLHSSSGGLTSLVATELLKKGLVDGIIHVGQNESDEDDALFSFVISYSELESNKRKKSQYYSLSFDQVLSRIRGDGKKYVFIGVPCFIKAIRNLGLQDELLKQQIPYTLGLVCGHLKSSAFAELLSWQVGVNPNSIKAVDFRKKNPKASVNAYDFMAVDVTGKSHARTSANMFAGGWGYATFQLQACDYCDDIFAETADAVFGDAWLPQFNSIWQGTNIVLTRNREIDAILNDAKHAEMINLEALSIDELCQSQQGNFRHRREGLVVRLVDDIAACKPVPQKRVNLESIKSVSAKRIEIVRLRKFMAQKSHIYFNEAKTIGDLTHFVDAMRPLIKQMDRMYKDKLAKRVVRKLRKVLGL